MVNDRTSEESPLLDFRRMGELQLCLDQDYQNARFSTHHVAPGDGDLARFQPASGIAVSYDDPQIVEAYRFIHTIATGERWGATVEDALYAVGDHRGDGRVGTDPPLGDTPFVNLF
jgi:hypothetical protein